VGQPILKRDARHVTQAIGGRALRLFDAAGVVIHLVDGGCLVRAAAFGSVGHAETNLDRPLDRTYVAGRAVVDRNAPFVLSAERLGWAVGDGLDRPSKITATDVPAAVADRGQGKLSSAWRIGPAWFSPCRGAGAAVPDRVPPGTGEAPGRR